MATWILPRDQQRQLERVFEAELGQFSRCGQGGDHVVALVARLKIEWGRPARSKLLLSGAERLGESNQPPSDRVEGCTNLAAGEQSAVPVTRDQRWRQARRVPRTTPRSTTRGGAYRAAVELV
jgi:hypothetical protein